MRWRLPTRWREAFLTGCIFVVFQFVLAWAGYPHDGPGPEWDDPIPFRQALSKLPRILMFSFLGMVVMTLLNQFGPKDDT